MKKFTMQKLIIIFFLLSLQTAVQAQELRGTWLARNSLVSKEAIASAMDSLAANNFNVVYVLAWSRGYPLWKSNVFHSHTGLYIDPIYANRDILAEAVAEGHRAGLHVEAWFEYGFVGGWTGNMPPNVKGPIFEVHPDWVAKKLDGSEKDNSNFYWMIHTHHEVQNFLIGLASEVARNYDIDGIELDRIRYSSLEYGYDHYTDSLYRSEHNGASPPQNYYDESWKRWRADKINEFMQRAYDSIKAVNSKINISNAPSLYSSSNYTAYNSYLQDWVWWVNNNVVDNVQVQSYVGSSSSFGSIIDYMSSLISDKNKAYPCFAVAPSGSQLPINDLLNFVNVTRQKGYKGNSIWYYPDLIPVFPAFKANVYSNKTFPPFSTKDWRELYEVISIDDETKAVRKGDWLQSSIFGFNGPSIYAGNTDSASVEYYFDVPAAGYYELYAFVVTASNRTNNAHFYVYDSSGNTQLTLIDQSSSNNRRWLKLGDFYLNEGRQLAAKITNEGLEANEFVSADAMYISLNRKLSPNVVTNVKIEKDQKGKGYGFNLKTFPNPFNDQTKIIFNLKSLDKYSLEIYNVLGESLFKEDYHPNKIGSNEVNLQLSSRDFPSGVYLLSLSQLDKNEAIKIIYSK